jgi:hypothetical protein
LYPAPDALDLDVHAADVGRDLAEPPHEGAHTAADVQYATAFKGDVATDKREAALQAEPPDIAGVTQTGPAYGAVRGGKGFPRGCLHFLDHNLTYGTGRRSLGKAAG